MSILLRIKMVKINTLNAKDKLFERCLNQLADPPKSLYYIGKIPPPHSPSVAIVGTRKPTPYGEEMAFRLARDLAQQGVVIYSGLAIGTDGAAHRGALEGGGVTVAVLAGGLDQVYPLRHRKLAQQIVESGGALISEYPPGIPCYQNQFVARNRIVAALADGVIITEAAAKSGSLHTANFALDLGRTVMAVPGLATNPMAAGCLNLIKTGAALVTGAEDVREALGYTPQASEQMPLIADSPEELTILQLIKGGVNDGEDLLAQSQLAASDFHQLLTLLEINGRIRALGGNRWGLR